MRLQIGVLKGDGRGSPSSPGSIGPVFGIAGVPPAGASPGRNASQQAPSAGCRRKQVAALLQKKPLQRPRRSVGPRPPQRSDNRNRAAFRRDQDGLSADIREAGKDAAL